MAHNKSNLPLWISLGLIALLVSLYFIWPSYHDFINEAVEVLGSDDDRRIKDWVDQYGAWGPTVIIAAMVLQMFLIVLPSFGLMAMAVLAYGPIWGTLLSIAAVLVASTVGYIIGYFISQNTLERLVGHGTTQKIEAYTEKYGFWSIVAVRLAPFLSNDATSFVAGALRMGFFKFILATTLGITPLAIAIGYFGRNISSLKTGLVVISIIAIAGIAAKILWDKRRGKAPEGIEN